MLTRTPVEENTFGVWFRRVFEACNTKGAGFRQHPSLHSLRTTMTFEFQWLDYSESQIIQHTEHKSITSLKCYTATLGYEDHLQHAHTLISSNSVNKLKLDLERSNSESDSRTQLYCVSIGTINSADVMMNYFTRRDNSHEETRFVCFTRYSVMGDSAPRPPVPSKLLYML